MSGYRRAFITGTCVHDGVQKKWMNRPFPAKMPLPRCSICIIDRVLPPYTGLSAAIGAHRMWYTWHEPAMLRIIDWKRRSTYSWKSTMLLRVYSLFDAPQKPHDTRVLRTMPMTVHWWGFASKLWSAWIRLQTEFATLNYSLFAICDYVQEGLLAWFCGR